MKATYCRSLTSVSFKKTRKLFAISMLSASLAWLPWQVSSQAEEKGSCNYYGCYPAGGGCNYYGCYQAGGGCNYYGCYRSGGGCNYYGCWHSANGSCNYYGCSNYGTCNYYGCPPPPKQPQLSSNNKNCSNTNSPKVLVELVARNNEWGNVWIDGKNVFSPQNFNRRQTVYLCPGGYRVIITGVSQSDIWASGYLDVGRTNVLIIAFSKKGIIEVKGDPKAWLADEEKDPQEIWR